MAKIKASELFTSLIKNSQLAFMSEDENHMDAMEHIFGSEVYMEQKQTIEAIQANNEFIRISIAKLLILTLKDYDIVDYDIDLSSWKTTNKLVVQATKEVLENSKL